MNTPNNRRFWEIMIGLLLLVVSFGGMGGDGTLPLILAAVGVYLIWQQMRRSRANLSWSQPAVEEEIESPPARQTGAEQVYAHAIDAVERAGRDPASTSVLPVDIGVMAFRAGQDPVLHRTQPVLDDVDYIQPFVQLRLPTRATGRIRFEIIDSDGQSIFIHEDYHKLERGRNLVTPAARLPILDAQAMTSDLELKISADGVLVASHHFGWRESSDRVIRRHMREDGEITNELRAAMSDNQPRPLSLDELLAHQEEQQQQVRR
jgi:hypothetical protein